MYKKTTLKNGLRIITVPTKNTQAVTVLVLVKTGSKYETKERTGISHFLEHMLFKGTKKRSSQMDIAKILDGIGGAYNAFTGEDYTGYYIKTENSHFNLALDVISDIFLNSLLSEKEIQREKGVIIEEINMFFDNPAYYIDVLWNKLLYGDQPAGWDILGSKKNVTDMNRQKLFSYMQTQYVASNTVICVGGKISHSAALSQVKKYFFRIETTKPKKKQPVLENQTEPKCLLHQKKTDQTNLCLGVRSYNIFHPQKYSVELLAVILGGMMSSRLFIELREKLGLAYDIRTSVDSNPDTGFLVTQAGVDNRNVAQAISIILKEYKKISQEKVPVSELKKAKDYIKGRMSLSLESSDAQASFYGTQELLKKKILTPQEIYAKINKVTDRDILKVAQALFQPRNLNLAILGPFKDKSKFRKLLKL